jgi:hypothetical protein
MEWQENHNGINSLGKKTDDLMDLISNRGQIFSLIWNFFPSGSAPEGEFLPHIPVETAAIQPHLEVDFARCHPIGRPACRKEGEIA